jgi:hypothetical protein
MHVWPSRTLSVRIARSLGDAYEFLAAPENFGKWASGVGASFGRQGETWIAQTPEGSVKIKFTPRNAFGVLDHRVVLPSGETVEAPMRVIANGAGCEVLFTLFQLPGMSEAKFAEDAAWVQKDLDALRILLEG